MTTDLHLCLDAYITQDGYDSGQRFVCPTHRAEVPVMAPTWGEWEQTYEVTLPMFLDLLEDHARQTTRKRTP